MTTESLRAPGRFLTLPAPYDRATSGLGALIGAIFGVTTQTVDSGDTGVFDTEGVHEIAKVGSQAWTAAVTKVYWDNTNKRCTSDAAAGPLIGVAAEDVGAGAGLVLGKVRLNGVTPSRRSNVADESSPTPSSVATAGAGTITAAMVLSKIYVRDCAGGSRTDTLDTAANIVAAVPNAKVGDVLDLLVINGSDAAEVITLAAGSGGAFDANQTASSRVVPQNASKLVKIRLTNVTASSEAYVVYA
jgi:predicted RecA/RadA family phage recombinase